MTLESAWADPRAIAAIVAAAISCIGVAISVWFNQRTRKIAETNIRIAKFNLLQAQRKTVFDWASSCQDSLARAMTLYSFERSESTDLREPALRVMTELSAQIDKGRWILPNEKHAWFGTEKLTAYQGFRDGALDHLVNVYRIIEKNIGADSTYKKNVFANGNEWRASEPSTSSNILDLIVIEKRAFTSEIQTRLASHSAREEFAELIEK